MKLQIEIPKEFEYDFENDRFTDFFSRVHADMVCGDLCGNYEKEICIMLKKAFMNAEKIED